MGHVFDELMEYIERQAGSTDVFCFQEMMSSQDPDLVHTPGTRRLNLLQEIQSRLPNHVAFFDATQDDFETDPPYPGQSQLGCAMFYHKDLVVNETSSFLICNRQNEFDGKDYATLAHNALYIVIEKEDDQNLLICSLHGNSEPASKLDSPMRLAQFEKVREFLDDRPEARILMGDFNSLPETQSVKMFEQEGMRNLVKEYNITTTRGTKMRELFPHYADGPYGFQEFADYTLVTPEVNVVNFQVPDEPISDHLPMELEIEF